MPKKRLLFAPPDATSNKYQDDDWKILCKNTPIPLYDLPIYFVDWSRVSDLDPPVLWCGWPAGREKLLEIAQRRYPNDVYISMEGEIINTTLFAMERTLRKEFNVPERFHECLLATNFRFPDGHYDYGLVVGNNHIGIIPPLTGIIDRIAAAFFDGEPPAWYLAPTRWRWTQRQRSRSAPHRAETSRAVATGVA